MKQPSFFRAIGSVFIPLIAVTTGVLGGCAGEPDYGESLCEAELMQPDPCDTTSACGGAVGQASEGEGACADELRTVTELMPASYLDCFNACPTQVSCEIGGVSFSLRSCGCQADCVRAAPAEYGAAVNAYADCLRADADVVSGCF